MVTIKMYNQELVVYNARTELALAWLELRLLHSDPELYHHNLDDRPETETILL